MGQSSKRPSPHSEKSWVRRRASFLSLAPGVAPRRRPLGSQGRGHLHRTFQETDSAPQNVKAHGSLSSRTPSQTMGLAKLLQSSPGAGSHQRLSYVCLIVQRLKYLNKNSLKLKQFFLDEFTFRLKKKQNISMCHHGLNVLKLFINFQGINTDFELVR